MEVNLPASSIKVRLVITSASLASECISNLIGVAATEVWLQGQAVHPKATNVHKENGWVLSVDAESGELTTERVVDRLLNSIPPGKLAALCKQYEGSIEAELSVILHVSGSESIPSISLTPSQVKFLADCSGSFDVDLYVR